MIDTGSFTADTLLHSPGILVYVLVLAFILGSVFASFITCMADRIGEGKTMAGRSHCGSCGHTLEAKDLVPVVSYLALRGRCRYCRAKIPKRCLKAELTLGCLFAVSVLRFGLSFDTLRVCGILVCLLGLSLCDMDSYIIPDRFWIAIVVITLVTAPFVRRAPGVSFDAYAAGAEGSSVSSYLITSGWAAGLLQGLIGGAVIAGGVLLISLIMDKALKKESMGGGDIKLLFSAGFVLGPAGGLLCLILSCIAGLLVVVIRHSEKIPFGPSIAVSLSLSLLFGQEICSWYLHLLGL